MTLEQTVELALSRGSRTLAAASEQERAAGSSQYVAFAVGGSAFAVDIMSVREIRAWTPTTALPNSPHYVRGIINLRGEIVPVVDMRQRFGQGDTEPTSTHVILVVSVRGKLNGLLVDAVSDLLAASEHEIAPVPRLDGGTQQHFLSGLISRGEDMIAVIDLDQLTAASSE